MSGPGGARVLVAGVGNVLRGDDGFGPAVVEALEAEGLPPGAHAVEVGIGGMSLLLELMECYDALVVVDAVARDGEPGTLYVLDPDVPPAADVPEAARAGLADVHELVPDRMLVLARVLGVLPPRVRIVGCEPARPEELTIELTPPVSAAVPRAVAAVRSLVAETVGGGVAEPPLERRQEPPRA
ncbi:MAG: hydrogenase maturation protease [Gemmatimonadetes bacterium]|nr:hydrogenase maturation protease [Gemmatimonadota bacterium]